MTAANPPRSPAELDELATLTVPTSGADAEFLNMLRDYAGALMRQPGMPRHVATLNRVLQYVARLHVALAAARRGDEDTARFRDDAERWRFVREHYAWHRREDDDEMEQTYLEARMLPVTDLSCAAMADYAIDRLRAAALPPSPRGPTDAEI